MDTSATLGIDQSSPAFAWSPHPPHSTQQTALITNNGINLRLFYRELPYLRCTPHKIAVSSRHCGCFLEDGGSFVLWLIALKDEFSVISMTCVSEDLWVFNLSFMQYFVYMPDLRGWGE